MLREHLTQSHDGASRRVELIDRHVRWIHHTILGRRPQRILDLGCGPGLYTQRLAALGHECTGVDVGPAAVEYARSAAPSIKPAPEYIHGDVLSVPLGGPFDFAMMVHGEFNVFSRDQASALLRRVSAAMTPEGTLLLEVHRYSAVEAIGRRGQRWLPAASGLFSDAPHLRLDESRWDADAAQAVALNWIIDTETRLVERYATRTQAYTDDDYAKLLRHAGLSSELRTYPSLTGDGTDPVYLVLTARKQRRPVAVRSARL
jgi:SAM-dependent methyltransferase